MRIAAVIRSAWQPDSPRKRLVLALTISMAVHGLIYGTLQVSPTLQRSARLLMQRLLPSRILTPQELKPLAKVDPAVETPVIFVEVDPAAAAAEPPKNTKFYSTHDTVAANPSASVATEVPKIDGSQNKTVRLLEPPKPVAQPLQPSPPKATPEPEPTSKAAEVQKPEPVKTIQETKPKPAAKPGDLAMVKTEPAPAPPQQRKRPRTLSEAVQRNPALAGEKSLQQGGVKRRAHISMVDAKGSPFGEYDYAFIKAVEQRWFQLLEENNQYLLDRQGKVTLTFRLHYDGRITDMAVDTNTVGDILALLCQKAIIDPSPFPRWPSNLRQVVRGDYRDVRFTFYYD